jgi:mono/diheme cytochrome c family protein
MSRLKAILAACILPLGPALAQHASNVAVSVGTPLTQSDLAQEFAIPPDGAGLPPGSGDAQQGQLVYAQVCSACHGENLQGQKAIGAPALTGGRGTLAYVPVLGVKPSHLPVKTVESYWPYATTLFDYVKRAMPMNAPGSLSNDQVYAVTAFILTQANILPKGAVVSAATLPGIRMPDRDGFRAFEVPRKAR